MAHYHLYFVKLKRRRYSQTEPTFNDETFSLVQTTGHDFSSGQQQNAGAVKWLESISGGWLVASDRPSVQALSTALSVGLAQTVELHTVKKLAADSVFDFELNELIGGNWRLVSNDVEDPLRWGHVQHLKAAGHTIEGFP
jgi:hypothetical protein